MATKIEWCDETINPFVGCTRISEGCQQCYAIRFAWRHQSMFGDKDERYRGLVGRRCRFCEKVATVPLENDWWRCEHCGDTFLKERGRLDWTGKVSFFPERLAKIPGGKPKRIFIGSMGDLFHENIFKYLADPHSDEFAFAFDFYWKIFNAMAKKKQHAYLLLTKRPEIFQKIMSEIASVSGPATIRKHIPNLWLGVTVENQRQAEHRIPELFKLRPYASTLFISVEPMLEYINLRRFKERSHNFLEKIDWTICGGESGPGKRNFNPEWAIDLHWQCRMTGVPFFFKGDKLRGEKHEEFPK